MKMTKQIYKDMGFNVFGENAYYGHGMGGFSLDIRRNYSLKYCMEKIVAFHEKLGRNNFKKEIVDLFQ